MPLQRPSIPIHPHMPTSGTMPYGAPIDSQFPPHFPMPREPGVIQIKSPIKGVVRSVGREEQPPDTCYDALNILPYDAEGRRRCSQRPGTTQTFTVDLSQGIGSPITALKEAASIPGLGSTVSTSTNILAEQWIYTAPSTLPFNLDGTSGPSSTSPAVWSLVSLYPSTQGQFLAAGNNLLSYNGGIAGGQVGQEIISYQGFSGTSLYTASQMMFSVTLSGPDSQVSIALGNNVIASGVNTAELLGAVSLNFRTDSVGNPLPILLINPTGNTQGFPPPSHVSVPWDGAPQTVLVTIANDVQGHSVYQVSANGAPIGTVYGNGFNGIVIAANLNADSAFSLGDIVIQEASTTGLGPGALTVSGASGPVPALGFPLAGWQGGQGRTSYLIAVCNGFVWEGLVDGSGTNIALSANQSTNACYPESWQSIAVFNPEAFIVDGSSTITQLNMPTNTLVPYVSSTSSTYSGSSTISSFPAPQNCILAVNWRDRLWLSGNPNDPTNFYMSRLGDPFDWYYGATDPAAPVQGADGTAGQVGEPITALIPFTDDLAMIGCTHSIWLVNGDPADGGSISLVSDNMGIIGKDAWCKDPFGYVWFLGAGGLYRVRPPWEFYIPPELMTGNNYDEYFRTLSQGTSRTSLVWDADTHYLHIYNTPVDGTLGTHLVFDSRNGGLWPVQFPFNSGPTAAINFLGDASANQRTVLLGGWDGYIRQWDDNATNDDPNQPIAASVILGPIKAGRDNNTLSALTLNLGELPPFFGFVPVSTNPGAVYVVTPSTVLQPADTAYNFFNLNPYVDGTDQYTPAQGTPILSFLAFNSLYLSTYADGGNPNSTYINTWFQFQPVFPSTGNYAANYQTILNIEGYTSTYENTFFGPAAPAQGYAGYFQIQPYYTGNFNPLFIPVTSTMSLDISIDGSTWYPIASGMYTPTWSVNNPTTIPGIFAYQSTQLTNPTGLFYFLFNLGLYAFDSTQYNSSTNSNPDGGEIDQWPTLAKIFGLPYSSSLIYNGVPKIFPSTSTYYIRLNPFDYYTGVYFPQISFNEVLSGPVDGVNTVFTLKETPLGLGFGNVVGGEIFDPGGYAYGGYETPLGSVFSAGTNPITVVGVPASTSTGPYSIAFSGNTNPPGPFLPFMVNNPPPNNQGNPTWSAPYPSTARWPMYCPGLDYQIVGNQLLFAEPPGGTPDQVGFLYATYCYLGSNAVEVGSFAGTVASTFTGTWNALITVSGGPDAYSVTEGTPHSQYTIQCGLERRQKTFRQRLRDGWYSITLDNSLDQTYFSFESATLEFRQAGRQRERR